MFYCYILKSLTSGGYYIGSTENLDARFKLHNSGSVKSTRLNKPWKIVYFENFIGYNEARKKRYRLNVGKAEKLLKHY